MAWYLFGAKPLSEPMVVYYELALGKNVKCDATIFIQIAFENVFCALAAILSQPDPYIFHLMTKYQIVVSYWIISWLSNVPSLKCTYFKLITPRLYPSFYQLSVGQDLNIDDIFSYHLSYFIVVKINRIVPNVSWCWWILSIRAHCPIQV